MKCRNETFQVTGKPDVKQRICRTLHGPVQERSGSKTAFARKYAIWGHEMDTIVGLCRSSTTAATREAAPPRRSPR